MVVHWSTHAKRISANQRVVCSGLTRQVRKLDCDADGRINRYRSPVSKNAIVLHHRTFDKRASLFALRCT